MTVIGRELAFAGVCLAIAACGRPSSPASAELPPGFVVIAAPDSASPTAVCAAYSELNWAVSLGPDDALVRVGPAMRDRTFDVDADEVRFPDGRLVATDVGEFGGGVTWDRDGRRDTVTVWNQNVMRLLRRGDTVIGVGGLAHLSLDYGSLVRFTRAPQGWRAAKLVDLGSAPSALQEIGGDSLIVLTQKNLQVIDLRKGTQRVVYANPSWPIAYPSSLVRDATGRIYVGLRHAVARVEFDRGKTREQWLVPATCPGFELTASGGAKEDRCNCVAEAH